MRASSVASARPLSRTRISPRCTYSGGASAAPDSGKLPAAALRRVLEMPGAHQAPACYDALSARLVERAEFRAYFTSVVLIIEVVLRKDNYNSMQRSIDILSFVLSLRVRVLFDNAKWAYPGGFSEEKQARRELNDPENALIYAFAGAITGAITTPLDVMKTRLMVQGQGNQYTGIVSCAQTILREEGPKAFSKASLVPTALVLLRWETNTKANGCKEGKRARRRRSTKVTLQAQQAALEENQSLLRQTQEEVKGMHTKFEETNALLRAVLKLQKD
ncbi:S-adenosylmethionine carrier 1, chloroplastic/mitochondrial [Zea mays]|uniref:S-adenosylmethionine carrier 1, chloroplastic/mitochondrial n=1 Tax=Zea mays TaxID=4577 RepID=A0A3L6FR03_MAIZE|nr:S-adenosylmethionine carrier 1, chloroplastic/mitochondrial [Zea mays]